MNVIVFLINVIDILTRLIILFLFIHVILSYFMSPFHPIRQWVNRIVEPLLTPIRRVIPSVGMIDFSPLVLIILVQVLGLILKYVLIALL